MFGTLSELFFSVKIDVNMIANGSKSAERFYEVHDTTRRGRGEGETIPSSRERITPAVRRARARSVMNYKVAAAFVEFTLVADVANVSSPFIRVWNH